jgi:hypothetical protein
VNALYSLNRFSSASNGTLRFRAYLDKIRDGNPATSHTRTSYP